MSESEPFLIDIGYPVYGAKFISDKELVVAGGGGYGSHGIPNRLSVLKIDFKAEKPLDTMAEMDVEKGDDAPMSLSAAQNGIIYIGANKSVDSIKSGSNDHLRKLEYSEKGITHKTSADLFKTTNSDVYQKFTALSFDESTLAIATSEEPTGIYVLDPNSLKQKYHKSVDSKGLKDLKLSQTGKYLAWSTSESIFIIDLKSGDDIPISSELISLQNKYFFGKFTFIDEDTLLIGTSIRGPKGGKGIALIIYSISLKRIIKLKQISKTIKGISALDISKDGLIALGGSDTSVLIISKESLKQLKVFRNMNIAVTNVCFNPSGTILVSTSAADQVFAVQIPSGGYNKNQVTFVYSSLSVILIALIAFILAQFFRSDSFRDLVLNKSNNIKYDWSSLSWDLNSYLKPAISDGLNNELESSIKVQETVSVENLNREDPSAILDDIKKSEPGPLDSETL